MLAGQFVRSLHDAPSERLGVSGDYLVEGEDSPSRLCLHPGHGICGAEGSARSFSPNQAT
jgi:hypothetical protein